MESLDITFVLPGADNIELVEKGEMKTINMDNLKEYIEGFSKKFFHQTIKPQLDSFREGFCHVKNRFLFNLKVSYILLIQSAYNFNILCLGF